MKVIKLGGSLLTDPNTLTACLSNLAKNKRNKIVIVPGGGVFADQVREAQKYWNFDQQTAHEMAILAMQQTALLFKSIHQHFAIAERVSTIQQVWLKNSVAIWSPTITQLNHSEIKASWGVSSDSLAAWLANQLKAEELILVKSTKIPLVVNINMLQEQGVIDKAFTDFINNAGYRVTVIDKYRFNEMLRIKNI